MLQRKIDMRALETYVLKEVDQKETEQGLQENKPNGTD